MKKLLRLGLLCGAAIVLNTGCTDSSYDLGNVDLTMGLGSEGLALKLGETECIMLDDILEIDGTLVKKDGTLYYLVKDGTTDFTFKVNDAQVKFEKSVITTSQRVLSYEDACNQMGVAATGETYTVAGGQAFEGVASGNESKVDFSVDGMSNDIISIKTVYAAGDGMPVWLTLEQTGSLANKLHITRLSDFTITLPDFLHATNIQSGWKLEGHNLVQTQPLTGTNIAGKICQVSVDRADLNDDGVVKDGKIEVNSSRNSATMQGQVAYNTPADFSIGKDDYADIELSIHLGDGATTTPEGEALVDVDRITGVFDPVINPEVASLEIGDDLPDFLQDDSVRIAVLRPTLKFESNLAELPIGINFSAALTAVKNGEHAFTKTIELPKHFVRNQAAQTLYYYQGKEPYDPNGFSSDAEMETVSDLATLIEKLPEEIEVTLADGHITVPREEATLKLNRDYQASAHYNVYIPFEFASGLTIVYRDSTDSFHDDIEDYQADGIQVTANALNSIPLGLIASIKALDVNGVEIEGIHFNEAHVSALQNGETNVNAQTGKAETLTTITLTAQLDDRSLLSRVDKLVFRLRADSEVGDQTRTLNSDQYLRFDNIRLRLSGQVVGNFN